MQEKDFLFPNLIPKLFEFMLSYKETIVSFFLGLKREVETKNWRNLLVVENSPTPASIC